MTPAEWIVVKDITTGALDRPPHERDAYVAERCGSDEPLRREVESLLVSVANATDLYEHAGFSAGHLLATLADGDGVPIVGGRIGAYRVLEEIGRGGMGLAFLAVRDDREFEKRVAIKLIKRGMDTDAILRRFRHERQILANLEHPNIVMLLDGGTTTEGLPYFVMEYVDGVPIDEYCDAHRLTIPARLKLFLAVCNAVQHAHQQRVVHRDLKPSNILVTASGVPKLLDFGIAKLLDAEADTQTGDHTLLFRVMTPQYASPEQVRGQAPTASSDIYSLGMLLYLLLAGRLPYRIEGGGRDAEQLVCEQAAPRPSTVVNESVGESRSEHPFRLRRQLAGNLDAIVLTALRKEPDRRYSSVEALADDIERHLDGRPIAARADDVRHRLLTPLRWDGSHRAAFATLAALLVVAVLLSLGVIGHRPGTTASASEGRSIAVLPLSNSGGDPEIEYLSDGITEDVINRLSRLPNLKVIARDSAYRYKDRDVDVQQVGRELGVDVILTGRVVQRGAGLSITTELVDTRDRRQLWGERFDRGLGDVQAVQRELAEQIANSLQLRFTGEQRARLTKSHTQNADAYQVYLRGRYFWNKRTAEGLQTSITYFTQAAGTDPSFALAYAGLADAYSLLSEYHVVPASETYLHARDAVTKALTLDDSLAEARTSLAYLRHFYEWDSRGAEAEFRRAIALNPNYATAHQWYAEFLSASGRHAEALAEIRTAVALDPVSLIVNAVEAHLLYMAGQYDAAITKAQQVIAMDPNFPEAYVYLKRAYDERGMYREAIEARQARRRLVGLDPSETPALRAAASATTARTYWRHRLQQEIDESREEGVQPIEFAEILAQVGDTSGALTWLERSCAEQDFMMTYIKVLPNLRPLRAEPRFLNVVRRGCAVNSK